MNAPSLFPDEPPPVPPGLDYAPEFLTPAEQQALLDAVDVRPWSRELKRRVQHHGYRYDYKSRRIDPSMSLGPLPEFVEGYLHRLAAVACFGQTPDQVIVNEYLPGQGIAAHVDCESCFNGRVASVSLGSPCEMEFRHRATARVVKLTLAEGSLLVIAGEARYYWTHQIRPRLRDYGVPRRRRVSLTFRKVLLG